MLYDEIHSAKKNPMDSTSLMSLPTDNFLETFERLISGHIKTYRYIFCRSFGFNAIKHYLAFSF